MPRQQRAVSGDGPAAPPRLGSLGLIALLVDGLAGGSVSDETVHRFLETIRSGLALDECSLWRLGEGGGECTATAGETHVARDDLPAPYGKKRRPRPGLVLAPLDVGRQSVGALVLVRETPLDDEEQTVLRTAAHLLASTAGR